MWFHGLTGRDSLQGGEGSETYYYNRGDGQDTIVDIGVANQDSIRFGAGILATQVSVSRGTGISRDDLILELGNGDRLTVQYYFYSPDYRVEDIVFAGGAGDDQILGGAGAATLDGGSDTYYYHRGDGRGARLEAANAPAFKMAA